MDLEEIVKKANSLPLEKKLSLFKLATEAKRIDVPYTEEVIEDVIESLNITYPDKWDLYYDPSELWKDTNHYEYDSDGELLPNQHPRHKIVPSILIHFPQFVITNSSGLRHTIYDMYIKIKFRKGSETDETTLTYFEGRRMSSTREELSYSYVHSHLGSGTYGDDEHAWYFRGFCTGNGDIDYTTSRLGSQYDSGQFRLFLLQIGAFLRWESIGGVPYRYIKNIVNRVDINRLSTYNINSHYENLKTHYGSEDAVMDLNFKMSDNYIIVKDDEKLENFLKYLGNDASEYSSNIICIRDENGVYYKYSDNNQGRISTRLLTTEENRKKHSFYFKGKLIEFQLRESNLRLKDKEFVIHPKIKQYVKQQIEQKIQKERFGSHITKQLNTIAHSRKSAKAN